MSEQPTSNQKFTAYWCLSHPEEAAREIEWLQANVTSLERIIDQLRTADETAVHVCSPDQLEVDSSGNAWCGFCGAVKSTAAPFAFGQCSCGVPLWFSTERASGKCQKCMTADGASDALGDAASR